MEIARCFRHMNTTRWTLRRRFPASTLDAIETAIGESETQHRGEIRFAIEGSLDAWSALRGVGSRDRAVQVFGDLGVWDTEENSGVLIYLLLADHKVEILADRGFTSGVTAEEWAEICRQMEREFSASHYEAGALEGVRSVGALLARCFPWEGRNLNELPDSPVVL